MLMEINETDVKSVPS